MTSATRYNKAAARGQAVPGIEHGGPNLEELRSLGLDPARILDFSVCTNPFGPSPLVAQALTQVALDQYPDREAQALRAAIAERYRVPSEEILAGNGVSELIWLIALAFVRRASRVLVLGPTYGEYARAAALQGGTVKMCNARPRDAFAIAAADIEAALRRTRPRLVFLCNPNNPTGTVLAPQAILSWVTLYPNTLFVVDEAYQGFVSGLESLVSAGKSNLLVLRSMTKDYALAGLRLGYAVGSEDIIGQMASVRPPWTVNALAQSAARAALADEQHLVQSLKKLALAKQVLAQGFADLGLPVCPSAAHFFLVCVEDGVALRLRLLRKGILVRAAASFGLPAYVRVATRKPEDNARLLAALRGEAW